MTTRASRATAHALLPLLLFVAGCGGGALLQDGPVDEQLAAAEDYLERGKEEKALTAFRIIAGKHSGTEWEEIARLGIGRTLRAQGDYFAAVQEFESFQRRFPRSPLVGDASLEIGLCYSSQRAKPEYDQEWNEKAVHQLEEFLARHPDSPRADEGREALRRARTQQAWKTYRNGETYQKLKRYSAARFYYTLVIDEYPDTDVIAQAIFAVGRTFELEKRWSDAREQYEAVIRDYPETEVADDARKQIDKIGGKGGEA